ncbi:hypothetical protein ACSVH5_02430 [Flavobacterium sp. RSSA_27]|uniref:hypothetical protein n=1 Tax=Flavobacterium sp. RSSA_27 TaxID=3447667 RepID=UPI003F305EDA
MTLAKRIQEYLALNEVLYHAQLEKEEWIDLIPLPKVMQRMFSNDSFIPKPDDTPRSNDTSSNEDLPTT